MKLASLECLLYPTVFLHEVLMVLQALQNKLEFEQQNRPELLTCNYRTMMVYH